MDGLKKAHIRDGAAVVQYLVWLDKQVLLNLLKSVFLYYGILLTSALVLLLHISSFNFLFCFPVMCLLCSEILVYLIILMSILAFSSHCSP